MFSFHKPRVYRSVEGCCICRAKSSSSRFTDSRRYELDSMKCFDLKHPRQGEICNACVLLVKRYKRLPVGSTRHWGHVVDARAGPGTKAMSRYKKYREPSDDNDTASGTRSRARNKNIITEKFSKIFKKTKKTTQKLSNGSSAAPANKSPVSNKQRLAGNNGWGDARVDSQPTTPDPLDSDDEDTHCADGAAAAVTVHKLGSKRRKLLLPRRHRRLSYGENVQFFDDAEWRERKSCCGMVYECTEAPGTLLFDLAHHKPCAEHQRQHEVVQAPRLVAQPPIPTPVLPVVQTNPTPALKKHHLFFKRQSECFPHGDAVATANYNNNVAPLTTVAANTMPLASSAMHVSATVPAAAATTTTFVPRHSIAKVTTISTATSAAAASMGGGGGKAHNFLHKLKADTSNKLGRNANTAAASSTPLAATRVKALIDMSDMKPLVKTVDKSYMLSNAVKPTITAISAPPTQQHQHQQQQDLQQLAQQHQQQQSVYHTQLHLQQPPQAPYTGGGGVVLTTAMASPSPTLSTSSSTSLSTKFSDNSSDSGFDENMQDRKSASPLQEDTERKLLARAGSHQTMFLASGLQHQGQQQNVIVGGHELAVKVSAQRQQITTLNYAHGGQQQPQPQQHIQNSLAATTSLTAATAACNRLHSNSTAVKIAHIMGNGAVAPTAPNNAVVHPKMRTIYNNNTIQHENGITTIVPASSLAACSQTAAMHNAIGPSTVTITPAPHGMKMTPPPTTIAGGNGVAHLNVINMSNSQLQLQQQQQQQHHQQQLQQHHLHHQPQQSGGAGGVGGISNLNQKFILVKTATKYNTNNATFPAVAGATAPVTQYTTATVTAAATTTIKTLNN